MPQTSNVERNKIVETMRAQNRATDAALWNALKRTPGILAGGAVDIGNLALGLITGRGAKGLVDKPIGGGESINEAFGMPKSSDTTQNIAELALSMLSPGGAAAAGSKAIIIPLSMGLAKDVGISKIADDAIRTFAKTGDQTAVARESQKALANIKNPEEIQSLFVGPDYKLRAVVSNANAKLLPEGKVQNITKLDQNKRTPTPVQKVMLSKELRTPIPRTAEQVAAGQKAEYPSVLLSDLLLHPSMYNLVPKLASTRVSYDPTLGPNIAGSAISDLNKIFLPAIPAVPRNMVNDPMGSLLQTLLHEATHVGPQSAYGVRTGTNTSFAALLDSLQEARKLGSYAAPSRLDSIENYLTKKQGMDILPQSMWTPEVQNAVHRLYKNTYGEWEAEAGSVYGPRTLPLTYGLRKTW